MPFFEHGLVWNWAKCYVVVCVYIYIKCISTSVTLRSTSLIKSYLSSSIFSANLQNRYFYYMHFQVSEFQSNKVMTYTRFCTSKGCALTVKAWWSRKRYPVTWGSDHSCSQKLFKILFPKHTWIWSQYLLSIKTHLTG